MQNNNKRLIWALAFLAFLAMLTPRNVNAQAIPGVTPDAGVTDLCNLATNGGNGGGGGQNVTVPVDGGSVTGTNAIDAARDAAKAEYMRKKAAYLASVRQQFPIKAAVNACTKAILTALSMGPALSSKNMLSALVGQLVISLINDVCGSIVSTISSVQAGIRNMTTICLPLPQFSPGRLAFQMPSLCHLENDIGIHGAVAVPLLGGLKPNGLFDANSTYQSYLSTTGQCAQKDAKGNCITQ